MAELKNPNRHAALPVRESRLLPTHEGKGFIVTGGTGGMGKAIVEHLLAQGARVVLADLQPEAVAATAQALGGAEKGCFGLALDVTVDEAIATTITRGAELLGKIDGLVNCAGIVLTIDPLAISRAQWERQFQINLFGCYEVSRCAARHMIDRGIRGAIVSIASEAGKKGHVDCLAYSASKAGVISMTRMLSEALAPHDINVNCVCPGAVATPMLRQVAEDYSKFMSEPADVLFDKIRNAQLSRHVQPVEVARVVSFLLSDEAMLIRGQAVNIDAGETPY